MKNETNCRSCGKPILMLTYPKTGKSNPIEKEPNAIGNLVINEALRSYRMATEDEKSENANAPRSFLHISHFATCRDAGRFRKTD